MISKAVRVNKFNFTYLDLAYRVRQNMLNALQPYDKNFNGQFEQPEITAALVNILNEDENQIRYVISNVFRYDKDGDKAVTYEQFVNFAVEQHFGQMAIQRLHRNGVYSRGKQRLMNLEQFQITLNESLKYIASQGSKQEYQHIYNEVDLDKDGWIKYEDFFMFLRQYFGSLSVAANVPVERVQTQSVSQIQPQPHSYQHKVDYPEQRFTRLLYSQLRITVMQHDLNRSLSLTRQEVGQILMGLFGIRPNQKSQLINLIVGSENTIEYERFMKAILPFYFCQYDIQRSNIARTSEEEFVQVIRNACSFIRVKPSELVLKQIFHNADTTQKGFLERNQYINTLGMILENHQFDTRGTVTTY